MKNLFLLFVLITSNVFAQNKYLTKTGVISFEASVPSFEDVAAKNNLVTAILNTENGEIAALVLVKAFRFKNALMEEHFNENYAESDIFPKATFKGKIQGFDNNAIKSSYVLKGELAFHGKSKHIDNIKVDVTHVNGIISLHGNFKVKASHFNIEIPKIVSNKIAEDIEISFEFELQPKK